MKHFWEFDYVFECMQHLLDYYRDEFLEGGPKMLIIGFKFRIS